MSSPLPSRHTDSAPGDIGTRPHGQAALEIREPGARLYLLARVLAEIEDTDQQQLGLLLACGLTPDLVQKLRGMSLVDAQRFTAGNCGLAITIDPRAVRAQFANIERAYAERELCEYFIHHGATPRLMASLFRVSSNDVRRMRKLLAPATSCGGRPRTPQEPMRTSVIVAWARISRAESSERQRFWLLHQEFNDQTIASLEAVVRPESAIKRANPVRLAGAICQATRHEHRP